jgi:hypothetical protein
MPTAEPGAQAGTSSPSCPTTRAAHGCPLPPQTSHPASRPQSSSRSNRKGASHSAKTGLQQHDRLHSRWRESAVRPQPGDLDSRTVTEASKCRRKRGNSTSPRRDDCPGRRPRSRRAARFSGSGRLKSALQRTPAFLARCRTDRTPGSTRKWQSLPSADRVGGIQN